MILRVIPLQNNILLYFWFVNFGKAFQGFLFHRNCIQWRWRATINNIIDNYRQASCLKTNILLCGVFRVKQDNAAKYIYNKSSEIQKYEVGKVIFLKRKSKVLSALTIKLEQNFQFKQTQLWLHFQLNWGINPSSGPAMSCTLLYLLRHQESRVTFTIG